MIILGPGQVLQPVEAVMQVFLLPERDTITGFSEKIFFLNTLFLFLVLYLTKFAVESHIPRVSEAIILAVFYPVVIILLLRYIALFNTHVREWGIGGLGYHIAWLVLLILVLGV